MLLLIALALRAFLGVPPIGTERHIALAIQELEVSDAFGPVRSRGRHAYARPIFGY